MKKYLKIVAVFIVAAGAATCVVAQEPASEPLAAAVVPADQQPTSQQLDRLFDVMRVKDQMASVTKMMPQMVQQQMVQQIDELQKDHPELAKLTPEQKEAMGKVMGKYMSQAMTLFTSDDIIADMKAIYQRHLTGNDVENLITFYNSPSGQHMLAMVPVVMQEFLPSFTQKMQTKMRPLIVEMAKEMAEIVTPASAKPDQQK